MRKRPLTAEEKALWEAVNITSKRLKLPAKQSNTTEDILLNASAAVLPVMPIVVRPHKRIAAKPLTIDDTTVLDKRNAMRLRRGTLPIEATLDLHGQTSVAAHSSLIQFIERAFAHQKRCLLVITGKGKRSSEVGGVLKKQLPLWLASNGIQEKILAVTPAQPKDGGSGAFYVLLRRQRG